MSDNKSLKDFDYGSNRLLLSFLNLFRYFRGILDEFVLISWLPEEGMKYFLKTVLLSILFSGVVVYSVDLLTGLFIREISVIIGSFF